MPKVSLEKKKTQSKMERWYDMALSGKHHKIPKENITSYGNKVTI